MSQNSKNRVSKSPMKNFTRDTIYRNIVVESINNEEVCKDLSNTMDDVNQVIQEVNLRIKERQISYITAVPVNYDYIQKPDDTRIVLRNNKELFAINKHTAEEKKNVSHLVEFQLSAEYNQITFSNSIFDAKLVIDKKYLSAATTDLFLDLVMFNSYSFLREMSIEEKKKFSKLKFDYFRTKKIKCFYTYDKGDELLYYSLAFSARETVNTINIPEYIALWNDFLRTYYPNEHHIENSLECQLKRHVDYGHLPSKKIIEQCERLPEGTYLFIKVNRKPRNPKNIKLMQAIFGSDTFTLGSWKIIPIDQYEGIKRLTQPLYISAFKLIK